MLKVSLRLVPYHHRLATRNPVFLGAKLENFLMLRQRLGVRDSHTVLLGCMVRVPVGRQEIA
jgi:hypothetical protein